MSVGPKQSPLESRCPSWAVELRRAVPRPYDGEMLRGHKSRVKAFLGIPSDQVLYRVLQRSTGQKLDQAQSYARLLAPILDLSFEDVLDGYSLYPLAFAFDRQRADQVPDVLRETRETHAPAFRRPAAFCRICLREDHYPHFRRQDQTPGVYWCAKHGCSLEFATAKGFCLLPGRSGSFVAMTDREINSCLSNAVILRYTKLCASLFTRPRFIDQTKLSDLLRARARSLTGSERLLPLGAAAADAVPHVWLERTFGSLVWRRDGRVRALDGPVTPAGHIYTNLADISGYKSGPVQFRHARAPVRRATRIIERPAECLPRLERPKEWNAELIGLVSA
jgi:hypothetical protein